MVRLHQDVAAQFMEIGVLRLRPDQGVGLAQRRVQVAEQIGGLRFAVFFRQRVRTLAQQTRHRRLALGVDRDLDAHHVVALLQRSRILVLAIGALLDQRLQVGDAFLRHRMADAVRIDLRARQRKRRLEALEGLQHALAGLMRGVEIGDGRAVGGDFFATLVLEQHALGEFATARGKPHARRGETAAVAGRARHHRAGAEQAGDDGHGLDVFELFAKLLFVAAGDMAAFVRDDADDLVRRLGLHQRAGVDEQAPSRDEGVEGRIVDQHDADAGAGEARRLEDRPRVVAHQRLDLGVAHHRHALRKHGERLRQGDGDGDKCDRRGTGQPGQRRKRSRQGQHGPHW